MGNDYRLMQITESLLEAANETLAEYLKEESEMVRGELIAYAEALTIIKEGLTEDEETEFHLDFDVDKKYIGIRDV